MKRWLARSPKKAEAAPDAAGSSRGGTEVVARAKGLSVERVGLTAAIIAVLIMSGVAALVFRQLRDVAEEHSVIAVRAEGARVASALAGRVQGVADAVRGLANDPKLASAVSAGDTAYLAARRDAVKATFPDALRVLWLTPQQQEPSDAMQPPLGYACLELVRHAESMSTPPPVEVHMAGTAEQHIDVVRPVRLGDMTVASLMVTLPTTRLQGWLRDAKTGVAGYAELAQQGAGAGREIANAGNSALKGGQSETLSVPGTGWQLTYWAPAGAAISSAHQLAFFAVFGAGGAVLFVALTGLFLWLGRILKADLILLIQHIAEAANGRRHHSVQMKLVELQQAVRLMDETVQPLLQPKVQTRTPAPQESAYLADDDDMPDLTFIDRREADEPEIK